MSYLNRRRRPISRNKVASRSRARQVRRRRVVEQLESRRLLTAQVFTPANISIADSATFDLVYTALDSNDVQDNSIKTTGVTLRMHYNSSEITPDVDSIINSAFAGATIQDTLDDSDEDGNSSTDRFVNFLWFDFQGNFPSGTDLPITLFTADFDPAGGFMESTTVGFSGSPPIGFDFQSTPAVLDFSVPPTLAIATDDADNDEGDSGASAFTFTVTRQDNTSGATTVDYAVTGTGTDAADAADFDGGALPTGQVAFADGESTQTITVNVAGDTAFENDESFTVTLSNASGSAIIDTPTAEGIIRNDDAVPTLTIAADSAQSNEGDSGTTAFTFTVTRADNTTGAATVDYAVTGGATDPAEASDFDGGTLPSGQVQFADGESTQTITINVAGDTLHEQDESFTVTLSNPSAPTTITTATANGLVVNDDDPPTLAITADSANKNEEDSGTTSFTFTVDRTGDASGETTVDYAVTGGATDPADSGDFSGGALPSGQVQFAADETSKTITIDVAGDTQFEPDESFIVTLSNPSGAGVISGATAEGVIVNDDPAPVPSLAIAADSADLNEGDSGTTAFTFTVTRSTVTAGTTTVDYAVTGTGTDAADESDFDGAAFPSGQVSFADEESTQTITIDVAGDMLFEQDESFTVTLSGASGGAVIDTSAANGVIRNDDPEPLPTLSIATDDADKNEGDSGTTPFTFTVTRGTNTTGATTVDYAVTGNGTESASGADFDGGTLPSGQVSFGDGETTQTITIDVAGETLFEPDEGFTVTLSNASGSAVINTATASGMIRNDDAEPVATLAIAAADADKSEGDSGATAFTFTVTRGTNTAGSTTVDYTVSGAISVSADAADFVGNAFPSGQVSFADTETTKTVTIDVAGDIAFEPDETFIVTLSNASGGASITTDSASGFINNDDVVPNLSIAASDANRDEGDSGATNFLFTVTRSGDTTVATTADFAVTGSGSSPAVANDFVGGTLPTGQVDFAAGQTSQTISIDVSGDMLVESNDGFTVTLSNASGLATISSSTATGLIINDDRAIVESKILTPDYAARPHLIAGDGIATAILFKVLSATTIRVQPVGVATANETVRILDESTNQVSSMIDGIATANVEPGGMYAILFEAQTSDRIYNVHSSAGDQALESRTPFNFLQPTDTNGDSRTTPVDALRVINAMGRASNVSDEATPAGNLLDVNDDSRVSALDALIVINRVEAEHQAAETLLALDSRAASTNERVESEVPIIQPLQLDARISQVSADDVTRDATRLSWGLEQESVDAVHAEDDTVGLALLATLHQG